MIDRTGATSNDRLVIAGTEVIPTIKGPLLEPTPIIEAVSSRSEVLFVPSCSMIFIQGFHEMSEGSFLRYVARSPKMEVFNLSST